MTAWSVKAERGATLVVTLVILLSAQGVLEARDGQKRHPISRDVEIDFVPEKKEYFLGEPTYVRFTLKNVGHNEVRFATGSDYRGASRPLRFKFKAWDKAGNEVETKLIIKRE